MEDRRARKSKEKKNNVGKEQNQGPRLPVSAFAGYGTMNRPQANAAQRTRPLNRTRNITVFTDA